ncbi:MAG: colicin V production protein [Proteobacteria bacterium]|nr:MAG: colicin V production protein [Pseudomonadota bacterium]
MTPEPVAQEDFMETVQLTTYDFVVLGIFLLFVGRGMWRGLLDQIVPLLALFFGYFAASRYHEQLFPFLTDISTNPKVIFISACVILFVAVYIGAAILGKGLAHVIQITITPWFDRLLGGVFGATKGALIVILLQMILGTVMAPENRMLKDCQVCPVLNELADATREIIRDERVKEALRQQEPAITLEAVQQVLQQDTDENSEADPEPTESAFQ